MEPPASAPPASEPSTAAAGLPPLRRRRRRIVASAVGIAAAVGLWIALTATSAAPLPRAPSFSLPRLGGGSPVGLPLAGTAAHHPVVITFFASWCGPCHRDLPVIAAFARQQAASHSTVQFLGVDGDDGAASGLAFARQSGVTFPVGADTQTTVAPRFTLTGYPDTVFVDGAGRIVDIVRGPVSRATLEREAATLARSVPG